MKKIEIFTGSPRKKGNSSFLANELKNAVESPEIEVNITRLYDYEIKPCVDCRVCKQNEM